MARFQDDLLNHPIHDERRDGNRQIHSESIPCLYSIILERAPCNMARCSPAHLSRFVRLRIVKSFLF